MSKLLILFLISLFLASSLAEENSRMLGKKWSNMPTATVPVTPTTTNSNNENVLINLGTTVTTKSWDNPDGSHVKQVITVEKTCLNGMVTTKTTTKTYTYTNVSTHQETETTQAAEESQGENVVVAVNEGEYNNYPTEEADCETSTMVVTEAEHNNENVVVTVEAGEAEENTPVNLGTTTVTKTWENADGSHVKQVIVIQKTCLNGLITTKTTTTTYTYTNVSTSTQTEEAEAVESEHEVEVSVEAPENVEVEVAVEHEYESYESTSENVAVEVEVEGEHAEECVVKVLPTTTITKSWDNANGSHVVQVITCEKTCCNGIITIKTTTKTYTYTNVIVHHEEEVQVEAAEESQGENVIVVVHPQEESTSYPMGEAECETKTTIETETEHNTSENVAVEVEVEGEHAEESEECVVKILPTIIKTKTWTNPDGSYVKQVITCERTSCNGVITIKTITKTYTWPAASMETEMTSAGEESSNYGKKW